MGQNAEFFNAGICGGDVRGGGEEYSEIGRVLRLGAYMVDIHI